MASYEKAATEEAGAGKAGDAKEVKLSCSEKFAKCRSDTSYCCYHDGLIMYNTPTNWMQILFAHLVLWGCIALIMWGFIELFMSAPQQTMWGFFIFFIIYLTLVAIMVFVGWCEEVPEEAIVEDEAEALVNK